jgi:hypothetical protein
MWADERWSGKRASAALARRRSGASIRPRAIRTSMCIIRSDGALAAIVTQTQMVLE